MWNSVRGNRSTGAAPQSRPHHQGKQPHRHQAPQESRPAVATPEDIAASATRRAALLRDRIDVLDVELRRLRGEMDAARPGSLARRRYKDRAKQVLRQKKSLERRLELALNQAYNMAVVGDAIEARSAAAADAALYQNMRALLAEAKPAHGAVDLRETITDTEEIQQLLNQPLDDDIAGMDDAALEAELEMEMRAFGNDRRSQGQHQHASGHPSADEARIRGVPTFDGPVGPHKSSSDAGASDVADSQAYLEPHLDASRRYPGPREGRF